jgi:hypothetical protein
MIRYTPGNQRPVSEERNQQTLVSAVVINIYEIFTQQRFPARELKIKTTLLNYLIYNPADFLVAQLGISSLSVVGISSAIAMYTTQVAPVCNLHPSLKGIPPLAKSSIKVREVKYWQMKALHR